MDDDGELKKRGESQSAKTAASIENARRFLYDEDEPELGIPANTPMSPGASRTNLSATQLGDGKSKDRLNPIAAAFMAAISSCRTRASRRVLVIVGGAAVLLMLILFIMALTGGESHTRTKEIQNKVLAAGITSKSDLNNKKGPQHHALSWLASVDKISVDSAFLLERYALAVLFYSTAGITEHNKAKGGWANQENWMTDKGFCSWYGVECGFKKPEFDGDASITAVTLKSNRLSGSLPTELVAMNRLITLDLTDNALSSTLPEVLHQSTALEFLLLGKNSLKGAIPQSWSDFRSLRELDLGHNQFVGAVPTGIFSMRDLQKLGLEYNEFEGSIPEAVSSLQKISK